MIILMGVAGVGKSVQGTLLAEKLNYKWLSTGEYLRANITGKLKEEMLAGKLLGDHELIEILKGLFGGIDDSEKCILDGFPRTLPQAEWLLAEHKSGRLHIGHILYFEASRDVVKARLIARGRPDDTTDAIDKRFDEFEKLTFPVVKFFEENGIAVQSVKAEGTVDEIHGNVMASIA